MTSILGISAFYHDSAAALVVDGRIETRLVDLEAPVLRIAELAIHLQRELREQGLKLNPQTQMTLRFDDQVLPARFGFPLRIRIPTKLGFKNPKHVIGMAVLNHYTGGYWEGQGYNWFSGL